MKGNTELFEFEQKYGEETEVKDNNVMESKMSIFCFMMFTSTYRAYEVSDTCVFNLSPGLGEDLCVCFYLSDEHRQDPKHPSNRSNKELQGWAFLNI